MAGIQVDTVAEQALFTVTFEHDDDLEWFRRCVRPDGARCGAGDRAIGVCRVRSSTRGELVPVDTDGIVLVEAGAAIALGPGGVTLVKPGADGRVVAAGDLDPDPVVGAVYLAAAAAGDVVPMYVRPHDPLRTLRIDHTDANEVHQRFVTAAGARAGAGHRAVGVSATESDTNGDPIRVHAAGITTVLSGGALVLAQGVRPVESDAQGRAVTHAGNDPVLGLVLDAAAGANVAVRILLAHRS